MGLTFVDELISGCLQH